MGFSFKITVFVRVSVCVGGCDGNDKCRAYLEIGSVVFQVLLHTHTQLPHPLPLCLQGSTVGLWRGGNGREGESRGLVRLGRVI